MEAHLDPCEACPRRDLDLRFKPDKDRLIAHIVMDGIFGAGNEKRRGALHRLIGASIASGALESVEAEAALECVVAQNNRTCAHYEQEVTE